MIMKEKTTEPNWEREVARIACRNMAQSVLALDVSEDPISDELQKRVQDLFAEENC